MNQHGTYELGEIGEDGEEWFDPKSSDGDTVEVIGDGND